LVGKEGKKNWRGAVLEKISLTCKEQKGPEHQPEKGKGNTPRIHWVRRA